MPAPAPALSPLHSNPNPNPNHNHNPKPNNLNSSNNEHQKPTTTGNSPNNLNTNGLSNRIDLLDSEHGRILCIADLRGAISQINHLAKQFNAVAVIHSGDFGFYEPSSLDRISDRTLRHLIQYSSLITSQFRSQLLAPSMNAHSIRQMILSPPQPSSSSSPEPTNQTQNSSAEFPLSEFPDLLTGKLKLDVPVYTVWGACEDVSILEKIRAAGPSLLKTSSQPAKASESNQKLGALSAYSIPNLTVLDEATTRCLVLGGIRLRLFGLGGAVVPHKLFDNGEGAATIAGGQGTMWTSILQIGEVIDTAQRVYDPTETRLLISHASPGREGLLAQLALVLKADLTISAGLHFRYGVSYNEFSVQHDQEAFRAKLLHAKATFNEIWDTVKNQVDAVIDDHQRQLLSNALAVANRVPAPPPPGSGTATEEPAWKNSWNWNLPDAAYGSLILDIKEGRIGAEMRSQGFNFAYRSQAQSKPPSTPSQINPRTPVAHVSTSAANPSDNQGPQSLARPPNQSSSQAPSSYGNKSMPSNLVSGHTKNPSSQQHQPESSTPPAPGGPNNHAPRSHQQHGGNHGSQSNGRNPNQYSNPQHRYSKSREDRRDEGLRTPTSTLSNSGPLGADSSAKSATQARPRFGADEPTKNSNTGNQDSTASTGVSPAPSRKSSFAGKKKKGSSGGQTAGSRSDTDRAAPDKSDGDAETGTAKNGTTSVGPAKELKGKIDSGLAEEKTDSSDKLVKSNTNSTESTPTTMNGDGANNHNYRGRPGSRGRGSQGQYNMRNNRGGRGGGRGMDRGEGFNSRPAGPGLVGPALAGAGIGNKSSNNNNSSTTSGTTGAGDNK
ncbi:hypothetical protein PGTUg99_004247 [Puccinia graminis f. sp. tritici]|uniref:DUF2433 domain-containing protein n=1 Tax=Puccinia graminis f. sp. tritici TaxID=56615 RepID=A0A5B0QDP0_PUCGR|nr:hypothetical protein PGTUg99_004247 [Puccinia graminis f. sp. tritici]